MGIKEGEKVWWISQSQGIEKKKEGIIRAILNPGDDPRKFIPSNVSRSRIKFDNLYPTRNKRILVEVERLGKNGQRLVSDWYCPSLNMIEKFINPNN